MALVPAKCPNCGGMIQIESGERLGICAFCKQPFISEEAINNYNTYNQNTYNIANADVHIHDEKSTDNQIERAETFLNTLGQPYDAKRIYESITKETPQRYEGWWGVVKADTNNLQNADSFGHIQYLYGYACNAIKVADPVKKIELKNEWNKYIYDIRDYYDRKLAAKDDSKLEDLQLQLKNTTEEIEKQKRIVDQAKKTKEQIGSSYASMAHGFDIGGLTTWIPMIIGFFVMFSGCLRDTTAAGERDMLIGTILLFTPLWQLLINILLRIVFGTAYKATGKRRNKQTNVVEDAQNKLDELKTDLTTIEQEIRNYNSSISIDQDFMNNYGQLIID